MRRKALAALVIVLPGVVALFLATPPGPQADAAAVAAAIAEPSRKAVVVGGLANEDLTLVTAAAATLDPGAVLLIDSPRAARVNQAFLGAWHPTEVVAVGTFEGGAPGLAGRLGVKPTLFVEWKGGPADALWQALFPKVETVVVCAGGDHRTVLQAACLAGAVRGPLLLVRAPGEVAGVRARLAGWQPRTVYAIGDVATACADLPAERLVKLTEEAAVAGAARKAQGADGALSGLVLANPEDARQEMGTMSTLAPWVALRARAALVLTGPRGDDSSAVVQAALADPALARADSLLIVAGLKAIPTEKRPNPVAGKDEFIDMEPMTPKGEEPFSFAVGRLFHEDPAVTAAVLARQKLLEAPKDPKDARPRKALVVSNPGGGLPLLETFSRHTTNELRNGGYQTTGLFENKVTKEEVRKLLPEQDIFLWEGHYRTLIDDFGFLTWDEPLPPSLVMLQSCLALKEEEAGPLFSRGAVAVVGSSTRTYSATGGAFTVAFFDGLVYDKQSLGGSLRQAKNYLLAYSMLKEKRLGDKAKLGGVNVRSAWAFSLWGDPTLRLPAPPRPEKALEAVSSAVKGNTLTVTLPETAYDKVKVGNYEAEMRPNGRLAGLLTQGEKEDDKKLVAFIFAEVALPKAPPGKRPTLTCKLLDKSWVFVWDDRRKVGYLLVSPRNKEAHTITFKIDWEG